MKLRQTLPCFGELMVRTRRLWVEGWVQKRFALLIVPPLVFAALLWTDDSAAPPRCQQTDLNVRTLPFGHSRGAQFGSLL